ncbi:MAG: hypothetical protein R2710_00625 [Acidimicrobiales bacterium]
MLSSSGGAGIWITAPLLATEGVAADRRGIVIGLLTGTIGPALRPSSHSPGPHQHRQRRPVATDLYRRGRRHRGRAPHRAWWRPLGSRPVPPVAGSPSSGCAPFRWKAITIAYVMFGAIASGYTSFLAEALEEDGGLSRSAVANIYIGLGITSLFGAPLMGWISGSGRSAAGPDGRDDHDHDGVDPPRSSPARCWRSPC